MTFVTRRGAIVLAAVVLVLSPIAAAALPPWWTVLTPGYWMVGACSEAPGVAGSTAVATRISIERNQLAEPAGASFYWTGAYLSSGEFLQVGYRVKSTVSEGIIAFAQWYTAEGGGPWSAFVNLFPADYPNGSMHWFNMTSETGGLWTVSVDGEPFGAFQLNSSQVRRQIGVEAEVALGTSARELRAAHFEPAMVYRTALGEWLEPDSGFACHDWNSNNADCTAVSRAKNPYSVRLGATGANDVWLGRMQECTPDRTWLW